MKRTRRARAVREFGRRVWRAKVRPVEEPFFRGSKLLDALMGKRVASEMALLMRARPRFRVTRIRPDGTYDVEVLP